MPREVKLQILGRTETQVHFYTTTGASIKDAAIGDFGTAPMTARNSDEAQDAMRKYTFWYL